MRCLDGEILRRLTAPLHDMKGRGWRPSLGSAAWVVEGAYARLALLRSTGIRNCRGLEGGMPLDISRLAAPPATGGGADVSG